MSLLTDLQTIVNDTQNKEITAHQSFMASSSGGPLDLKTYFKSQAQKGRTEGSLHIEKDSNPRERASGFATLSGELGILNAEPARGIVERNDIGWFYFNMSNTSRDQFQQEVTDLITYLTTEGLTIVSNTIGAEMADIVVSWA